jgi:hypothetical protein
MSEALSALSQAGRPPNFGDDDGGRVLGSPARPLAPSPAHSPSPPQPSLARAGAGIYTMTTTGSQLFIDAGPQGVFAGGHGHADALSIQLITDGRPILIDPGTFCYTCPERDRFRGTAAHNTLQVDGRDQAAPAGPFAWTGMPETAVDLWLPGETFDLFAGHHNGYAPVIHHRWVFGHKSGFWLVRDVVTEPRPSGSGHRLDLHWHLLDQRDIAILPPAGHTWSHSIERFDWSPVYGKKEPAFVQRFSAEVTLPAEFAVILTPAESGTFTQTGPALTATNNPRGRTSFLPPKRRPLYLSCRYPQRPQGIFHMKLLWVKAGGLLPPDTGGKIRSFNILKQLARKHDITLFTFYPEHPGDLHPAGSDMFSKLVCVPLPLPPRRSLAEYARYARMLLAGRPFTIDKYFYPEVRRRYTALLASTAFDLIVCDFIFPAPLIEWKTPPPKILFTHNVEAQVWARHSKIASNPVVKLACWLESRALQRAERRYVQLADYVLAVSENDRASFAQYADPRRISVIPTGVDTEYFQPGVPSVPEQPDTTVFTGSMDWMPNEDGVAYFVEKILPVIRREIPEAAFWAVGRRPPRRLQALASTVWW